MNHKLPELPYLHDALEPHIDKETMCIHHEKHHAGYVSKLNAALEKINDSNLSNQNIESLLSNLNDVPEEHRAGIRNNGGGHYNHTLFWESLSPNEGKEPTGALADALNSNFGSFDEFKNQFATKTAAQFGSGWGWLCLENNGSLSICTTANQDNPIMFEASRTCKPLLGLDVWEHAYYLKYQNKRPDYINAWWNIVNWDVVAVRLSQ